MHDRDNPPFLHQLIFIIVCDITRSFFKVWNIGGNGAWLASNVSLGLFPGKLIVKDKSVRN